MQRFSFHSVIRRCRWGIAPMLVGMFLAGAIPRGSHISCLGSHLPLAPAAGLPQTSKPTEKKKPTPPGEEAGDVVKLSSELVVLDVTVTDPKNQPVADLDKDQFVVFENDVKQEIAFFAREEYPASIGLLLDTSGSMKKKLPKVIAAAKSLIRQSHPQDEFFLVEFKGDAELVEDFTEDVRLIEEALDSLVASGQTALLDALYLSVEHAQSKGKHRRKAIIVVSDGEERDSYYKRDQVLDALRQSDVQVFAIGFPEGLGEYAIFHQTESRRLSSQEKKARKLLEDISRISGGRAFFPESLDELDAIAQTIARELRTQYVIGYYPTAPQRDGTWRAVRVEVVPDKQRGKLIARTRSGYYATPQPSIRPDR